MLVRGHGLAEVTSIGAATGMGKIGASLEAIKPERTLLQKEIDRFVRVIATVAVAACLLLTLIFWLTRGDLLHGFLAGLTLAISALPEEFPVVLTVFMALGAWRLAKNNVLSRKNRTIETLGSATVLCTDKTGTLTENIMTIQAVTDAAGAPVSAGNAQYRDVVHHGVLASQKNPFDPMEEAFLAAGERLEGGKAALYGSRQLIKEYPLEPGSLSVVHVWQDGSDYTVAVKGAPEAVLKLCKADEALVHAVQTQVETYAKTGLRVLAVGKGKATAKHGLPEQREKLDYVFLGLVALADPIRPTAAPAVGLCKRAGIRVVMITGDYAETARSIGAQIGLDTGRVTTGEEFRRASPEKQREIVSTTSIFSRVLPEDKLRIVDALKANGEIVAMTGDGVNDAPALKAAHIGIAMGKRGTDVAREAAAIVLLDDNFASIVQGVRLGRRIFTNLQKAIAYLLIVHVPIILLSLLPVLFGWPLVLLPVHIVFLEFIIDPTCTLVFESESEEPGSMDRPPRKLGQPMFSRQFVLRSVLVGVFAAAIITAVFGWLRHLGWTEEAARSIAYLMLIVTNLAMILTLSGGRVIRESFRGGRPSPLPLIVVFFAVVITAIYTLPVLQRLFKIEAVSLTHAAVVVMVSVGIALLARLFRVRNA